MKWYYRIWGVLLLLFVILGPLGLPCLWKSPQFSRPAKIVLTIAVILYTGWLILLAERVGQLSLGQLDRLSRMTP